MRMEYIYRSTLVVCYCNINIINFLYWHLYVWLTCREKSGTNSINSI